MFFSFPFSVFDSIIKGISNESKSSESIYVVINPNSFMCFIFQSIAGVVISLLVASTLVSATQCIHDDEHHVVLPTKIFQSTQTDVTG